MGRARSARPTPPRHAARPDGQGRLTAGWQVAPGLAGLRSRAQEVSLSLRQPSPACCGCRLPRRRQSPARSRRAAGCMSSSHLYSPPPPAPRPPARSCHGPGMLTSGWEQKAPLGPRGAEPCSLAPRARRSLEVRGWRAALLPFRAAAPPRPGSPPGSPEREEENPGEEGGGGARARAGQRATGAEREGAAERIGGRGPGGGASARLGQGARAPAARLGRPTPLAPPAGGKAPPREGERREPHGEPPPHRANPLTKESPALFPRARPPAAPAASPLTGLRAQPESERTQKGHPRRPQPAGFGKGHSGPHLPAGSRRLPRAACLALGSSSAAKGSPSPQCHL